MTAHARLHFETVSFQNTLKTVSYHSFIVYNKDDNPLHISSSVHIKSAYRRKKQLPILSDKAYYLLISQVNILLLQILKITFENFRGNIQTNYSIGIMTHEKIQHTPHPP